MGKGWQSTQKGFFIEPHEVNGNRLGHGWNIFKNGTPAISFVLPPESAGPINRFNRFGDSMPVAVILNGLTATGQATVIINNDETTWL